MFRTILVSLVSAFLVVPPPMFTGYTLIDKTSKGATGSDSFVTTSAISSSGADLLIVAVTEYTGSMGGTTITDSVGGNNNNACWAALTTYSNATIMTTISYCQGPTHTGASHTFTATTGSGGAPAICVETYSGSSASPLDSGSDKGTHSTGSDTSLQLGSAFTPSVANSLVISAFGTNASGASTAVTTSGFSKPNGSSDPAISWGNMGCSLGASIQTSAVSVQPTWTSSLSTELINSLAVFKGTGPAVVPGPCLRMLLGVSGKC